MSCPVCRADKVIDLVCLANIGCRDGIIKGYIRGSRFSYLPLVGASDILLKANMLNIFNVEHRVINVNIAVN